MASSSSDKLVDHHEPKPDGETPSSSNLLGQYDQHQPHPDTKEILRQVEYYFSDENLPGDAHLLGKTGGDGNGPVSIKHILGFSKMRKYKPVTSVIASLRQSRTLLIIDDKFIQRREPLAIPLRVTPKTSTILEDNAKKLQESPWLTKGMLKPTGLEENATESPLDAKQYAEERHLYSSENAFHIRIEIAVARFAASKKFHQLHAAIFTKFLLLGGFHVGPKQFVGALSANDLDDDEDGGKVARSKKEIAQMSSAYTVAETVTDGLYDELRPDLPATWTVDFEGMAKSFLSSVLLNDFQWHEPRVVQAACTVLTKFYGYLLQHDVCNEYRAQIEAACKVCEAAGDELRRLATIERALLGTFNEACSQLHGGYFAERARDTASAEEWRRTADASHFSPRDAFTIFATAVMAHGSPDQVMALERAASAREKFKTIWSEDISLKIVRIEPLVDIDEAHDVYSDERLQDTVVKPTGRLHCVIWKSPEQLPQDLSPRLKAASNAHIGTESVFWVDADVLHLCSVGMRLDAHVCELEIGIKWIDAVFKVYPSFFVWVENERMRGYKEPGEPKEWMKRQMAYRAERAVTEAAEDTSL